MFRLPFQATDGLAKPAQLQAVPQRRIAILIPYKYQ
jgi:hypothetical protein